MVYDRRWFYLDLRDMDETIARALYGWEIAKEKIAAHNYDLIILDEFTYAMHFGWLDANQVVDWLKANKPEDLPGHHRPGCA